jgi:hypothetical protein
MYDNAMQAMIKKKEEEFAQLQVSLEFYIFGSQWSKPVLPGPANPSLPLQTKTTVILAPSTATYHKYRVPVHTFFMLFKGY